MFNREKWQAAIFEKLDKKRPTPSQGYDVYVYQWAPARTTFAPGTLSVDLSWQAATQAIAAYVALAEESRIGADLFRFQPNSPSVKVSTNVKSIQYANQQMRRLTIYTLLVYLDDLNRQYSTYSPEYSCLLYEVARRRSPTEILLGVDDEFA